MLPVWSIYPPPSRARRWLTSPGSLTARLQANGVFSVTPLFAGPSRATPDELRQLGVTRAQHAYVREVCLSVDGQACVLARTVTTSLALRRVWRALRQLGRRSLGAALLGRPGVRRGRLSHARLRACHPVYRRFDRYTGGLPATLVARRSCFVLRGEVLLVMEAFLPAALELDTGPFMPAQRGRRLLPHNRSR